MKRKFLWLSFDDWKFIGTVVIWAIAVFCLFMALPFLLGRGGDDSIFDQAVEKWNINSYLLAAAYILLFVGALVWISKFLYRSRKKNKDRSAETMVSLALVFFFLQLPSATTCSAAAQEVVVTNVVTTTMPCAPEQEGSVAITATNNPVLLEAVMALGEEITAAQLEALMNMKGVTTVVGGLNSAKASLAACIIITVVISVVIMGVTYVFVKILKRCKQIEEKRKKQTDDAKESVINRNPPTTSTAGWETNSVRTVTAASFVDGTVPQSDDDKAGYGNRPTSFHYVVRGGGAITLVPNLGTKTVSADDDLENHGLPPNLALRQNCFAVNGVATNAVPVVSYLNGVVFVGDPGASDRVVTIVEQSTDLINWCAVRGFVAPSGTVVSFSDGVSSSTQNFYRVLVVK